MFVLCFKRPYKDKLTNILNTIVESAYVLIYVAFLVLHFSSISPENEIWRHNWGTFMIVLIAIIIGRCVVDLVVGIIETVRYIRNYCRKRK